MNKFYPRQTQIIHDVNELKQINFCLLYTSYMQMAINDNPKMKSRCFTVRWQPDKNWYEVQKTKWLSLIHISILPTT